jgi:hypothetical protein
MKKYNNHIFRSCLWAAFFTILLPIIIYGGNSVIVPSQGIPTITEGLINAKHGDTVWVKAGVYKEHVSLLGGITLASRELFKAVIDGKGRGDIVTISSECTIIGFEIRNGNAGIISRGPNNIIKKCKIYKNRGSGIICMGNLPKIESNIIVYNEGSGIQALDIKTGYNMIEHNTIASNGNNGIAFIGDISITIQNNIISSNYARGIKITPEDTPIKITHNNLYGNHRGKFTISGDNFSFDPLFAAPKRKSLDFSLKPDSKAIKKGNDNKNLGALLD